jgi:hypothetical protein
MPVMITRTRVGAAVAIAALLVTACSWGGDDERSEPVETESSADPTTSRPTGSTTTTIEPSPPTTADGLSADEETVLGAVTLGLTHELDGTSLAPPDGACFHRALASMDEAGQGAAEYLATNVTGWSGLDPSASRPLVAAFIGCSDLASVHMNLAIGLIGALDAVPCVVDAWEATLTEEVIVDSIAEASSLDDLLEPYVRTLTDGAQGCVPDSAWWVEDIALDVAPSFSLMPTQATCVVEAYVETFAVDAGHPAPHPHPPDPHRPASGADGARPAGTLRHRPRGRTGARRPPRG